MAIGGLPSSLYSPNGPADTVLSHQGPSCSEALLRFRLERSSLRDPARALTHPPVVSQKRRGDERQIDARPAKRPSSSMDAFAIQQGDAQPAKRPFSSPISIDEDAPIMRPATQPITEQQLINEVKGIYSGLVMVEKKCIEVVAQQSQSRFASRLNDQQWKALVALHRTLLQEHHDFFSALQHPTASEALKKLAFKYAMPARMWRHGIHAFLELLRHRLPDSMEYMLSFIYLSYSMMALLKECEPDSVETWIECLGDLARYRMATEDNDPRDREIWSHVARTWYNEAADKSSNPGRIHHHLAVLARPNVTKQLFYYQESLMGVIPHARVGESTTSMFDLLFKNNAAASSDLDSILRAPSIVSHRKPENARIRRQSYRRSPGSLAFRMLNLFSVQWLALWSLFSTFSLVQAYEVESSEQTPVNFHPSGNGDFVKGLLWVLWLTLVCLIPIVGTKVRINNLISVSSITAFMTALAMSANADQEFPNVWGTLCAGISIGFSLLLLRETRASTNSTLVAFLRYIAPGVVIWQVLFASELGGQGHRLDLSVSIPCLSVFGSVGINALLNEKYREVKTIIRWFREQWIAYYELEREQSGDEAV